jgi:hypothetical protein
MGDVRARNIKVRGKIVTGVDIEGAASDAVLKAALKTAQQLQGSVVAEESLEAGEIITGLRYLNPKSPDLESFKKELQALQEQLADLATQADMPAEVGAAAESVGKVMAETQKEQPMARRVLNRLRESLEFMTDAGKALEAAGKAGPLIAQAIGTATVLYQAAQILF